MARRLAVLLLLPSLLSGCMIGPGGFGMSGDVAPVVPSAAEPHLSAAQASRMQRPALRELLGVPVVSSAYWGFDLYRADVEQERSLLFTWLGLPFAGVPAGATTDHSRYTLVAYDQSGQGSSLQTGIVRNPSWMGRPTGYEYSKLYLRAAELLFFMDPDWGRGVNLLATPTARDVYLSHARTSDQCTVILGCGNRGCPDQFSVDGSPSRRLPIRAYLQYFFRVREAAPDPWLKDLDPLSAATWFETLVALRLGQSEHVLELSSKQLDGSGSLKLSCQAGAVTYVVINPVFRDRKLVDWQFEVTDNIPSPFSKRPLVLVSDGQWYVDQEPKN
jgi:hypothetical protein